MLSTVCEFNCQCLDVVPRSSFKGMSVEVGDLVFLVLHGDGAEVSVTGWAVETLEGDVVVGTDPGAVSDFENKLEGKAGDQTVAFVRVPQGAASTSKPPAWAGPRTSSIPNFGACKGAWKKVTHIELASSEAEAPESKPKPKAPKTRLSQDLKGLQRLFAEDSDDEEEDSDVEEPAKFLPPGRSSMPKPVKQKGTKSSSPDLQQLVMKSLAEGGDTKDVLTLAVLAQLLDSKKKRKGQRASSSRDAPGGSSSDSSDSDDGDMTSRGMKAVSTLNRLHKRIERKPKRIIEDFEADIIRELGIVPGQAWTVRDFVKKQSWGRFKGLYRAAMMDAAAYEWLRSNKPDVAAAQIIQNLKAKLQAVLQNGEWETAWLLTGLADPLHRKEWSGTREEMSVISGYVEALAKLKKRVKETSAVGDHDEEEGHGAPRK